VFIMSSNLNYKQVANVERRTWDVEEYEKKAQARASGDTAKAGDKRPLDSSKEDEKEEFRHAEKGAAGPERSKRAFLKARREKVDIDSRVGSTEIVSAEAAATTSTKLDDSVTGSIKVCCDNQYVCRLLLYSCCDFFSCCCILNESRVSQLFLLLLFFVST